MHFVNPQHLHYFANSGGPADITPLDRLKRTVLPMTRYFHLTKIASSDSHWKGLACTHCSDTSSPTGRMTPVSAWSLKLGSHSYRCTARQSKPDKNQTKDVITIILIILLQPWRYTDRGRPQAHADTDLQVDSRWQVRYLHNCLVCRGDDLILPRMLEFFCSRVLWQRTSFFTPLYCDFSCHACSGWISPPLRMPTSYSGDWSSSVQI